MLLEGRKYARINKEKNERIFFPFKEDIGIFKGTVPSGFLIFTLTDKKEVMINPKFSYFELICDCGMLIDSSQCHLVRMDMCESCADGV